MARKKRLSARKQPTQDRAKQAVEHILEAAARILVKDGFAGANTNRIAEVAGISVGSLYQYFPNKESIVAVLQQRHVQEMVDLFSGKLRETWDAPIADIVKSSNGAFLEAHRKNSKLHTVLEQEVPRHSSHAGRKVENPGFAQLFEFLKYRRPDLPDEKLSLVTFIALRAVEGVVHAAACENVSLLDNPDFILELNELSTHYLERFLPDKSKSEKRPRKTFPREDATPTQ